MSHRTQYIERSLLHWAVLDNPVDREGELLEAGLGITSGIASQ